MSDTQNRIEDLELKKAYLEIADYKISCSFFEYEYSIQLIIRKSLGKISTELGITDAIIGKNRKTWFKR